MRQSNTRNLFVITGGPGAGKTTLLHALQARGFAVAPEAGRSIIRAQREIGGRAGNDGDRGLYAELMLSWELRSYEEASMADEICFFDRGLPDIVGYLRLSKLPVPQHVLRAVDRFRYNSTVFILPHWPEIYVQDAERAQTAQEAERTCTMMQEVYGEVGYRPLMLPRASVDQRCDFVLAHIEMSR